MVFGILALVVLAILGLVGWCAWRFCRKKRPKKDDKDLKKEDDENALVDNEEIKEEEVRKEVTWFPAIGLIQSIKPNSQHLCKDFCLDFIPAETEGSNCRF